ncbi:MAG: hypothetical protein ABFS86_06955 [Planctomycetota bacterium]
MKTTVAGLCLVALVLALATVPVSADNGEYRPPKDRIRPPGGSRTPTGGRSPVPTPSPGRSKTPRLGGPENTPSPGTATREAAISWELVWELLRSAEPTPPPDPGVPSPPEQDVVWVSLHAALEHESREVRMWAALALGRAGWSAGLLEPLAKDGELMRTPAVLATGLSKLGETDLERALALLKSVVEDPEVPDAARIAAIVAAGLCGPKGANLLLKTLSGKPGEPVRSTCLFALGLSGHPGARDLLVPAVLPAKEDDDPVARALLVHGLSLLPGPESGGDLRKRLRDPALSVRTAAALSLASRVKMSPEVRRALVDTAKNGPLRPRSAALLALVLGGDPEADALCRGVLASPATADEGLAALAALGLGLTRDAVSGAKLVRIAGDRSLGRELRCAAAVAAGLVRARGGGPALLKIAGKEKDAEIAGYAFVGAMLIEPVEAGRAALAALGKEERLRGRELIVMALGHATTPGVTRELVKRLGDDYEVNREAARSLFRVDPARALGEIGPRLGLSKNPFERRYAAIVMGGALDRTRPTRFARHVLGVGLDARHPVTELFLYLESDILHGRWGMR